MNRWNRRMYGAGVVVTLAGVALMMLLNACGHKPVFKQNADVGNPKLQGSCIYDDSLNEYRITGAGVNIWAERDEFHFAWKEVEGDFVLSAKIAFEGAGINPHRKMGLIIRESLDADARYADIVVHGDGLVSLQYRPEKGGITQEVKSTVYKAETVVLQRTGNKILAVTGENSYGEMACGPVEITLPEKCFVGLFICSHEADVLETGYFTDVVLQQN